MLDKNSKIKKSYDELTEVIEKQETIVDNNEWKKLVKERNSIEDIALAHDKLEKLVKEKEEEEKVIAEEKDHDMKKLFEEDLFETKKKIEELEEEIKVLLLPKDENDESNVIVEIRAAAGGEESALFGAVLMKMYTRFAERKHWTVEMIDVSETELGGIKEAVFLIKGKNAYKFLKYESGVHRVQRVPETETQGRVHTSTVTVAILPEVQDVDFEINEKDIKIDTYRSSGAGGQHVNKTDSAIRITHFPTGIVVACQDERSQIKNRERAMSILKSKLYDYYKTQQDKEYAENRRSQVGTGDRSERIRTYNYPQGRITDHRINYSIYNMDDFLDGDIEEMSNELQREDQKRKLEKAGN